MAHTVAEGASESDSNLSFFWSREGEKGEGGTEGASFKPKAISFFCFFYELTLADVWLYHSQCNSQAPCAAVQGNPALLLPILT